MFTRYSASLLQAVSDGSGKNIYQLNAHGRDYKMLSDIRNNIISFCMAKIMTIKKEAKQSGLKSTLEKHRQYAEAEYRLILSGTQMGQKWRDIVNRKNELPWLRYDAVNDERTREDHKKLDGVTLPVEDPFWNTWLPPNGWNCRCTVLQLASAERVEAPSLPNDTETPPYLRHNPGISGIIFGDQHGYFKQAATAAEIRNAAAELALFDIVFINSNGAKVLRHPFGDPNPAEAAFNLHICQIITDSKLTIRIEPYKNVRNKKNPDFSFNSIMGDFKQFKGNNVYNFVENGAKDTRNKSNPADSINLICYVMPSSKYNKEKLSKALARVYSKGRKTNVKQIWIVIDRKLVMLDRTQTTEDVLNKILP